ncbi:Acetamidase [Candida viswanathii]|uniref:Acetamidase n=1 Tax=Candida viswanathii TaxID=5486 RepID=A0A367XQV1_9ASCO|nr:Acetamidase [Candida viswanathii]
MTVIKPIYKDIALKKRAARDAKFNPDWLYLTPQELEITESSAVKIVANIKDQKWTALDVATAFCHRATIAHQLTNCLTEIFFDEAIETAKKLDEYQQSHNGDTVGPFHGLPISLKDNFNVKGQATTIGMVNFCFNPAKFEQDATLVSNLRDLGAVLYVKTNVPVAMMMPETTNHVWGNTLNPMNTSLTSGGYRGSIRIPASFQNLYAIRPSFGRFPTYGTRSGLPGLESVNSVNGPLCNSIEDLEFYCKSVIGHEPWMHDAKCVEIPWRDVELPETLNIAVLTDDGFVRPTPPIRRGMDIVIERLTEAGHDVIEWDPVDHVRLAEIIGQFFVSDGGHHVLLQTTETDEPLFPYMENYGTSKDMKVSDLWKLQSERTKLMKDYLDRWNETANVTKNGRPIDAIIMPATPFAGSPIGKFPTYVGYTSPFNVLDYSVGTFPVTRANKDLDGVDKTSTGYNDIDVQVWQDYNPEESHGGAVALQLIGRRFQEEKVVAMMKVISELIEYSD